MLQASLLEGGTTVLVVDSFLRHQWTVGIHRENTDITDRQKHISKLRMGSVRFLQGKS